MSKKTVIIIIVIVILLLIGIIGILSGTGDERNNQSKDIAEREIAKNNDEYKLEFGDLLEATENDIDGKRTLIVKAKITDKGSISKTIDQNYYNIEDLINNQGCESFDEIQYWAVADMSNGSENKVLSFTVNNKTIDKIASGSIPANTIGDYVDDLWIHKSLE